MNKTGKISRLVHFELGCSLVAQCGELITRVLYTKTTSGGQQVVLVDAGMTDLIRPALYQAVHSIRNLTAQDGERKVYTVAGPICESSDVFAHSAELPDTNRGDLLSILSAAAYGRAMASNYNLRDFPREVFSDEIR
jgi:diaminopimelate decarboxylase